jgi:outer membrane protein OmpA-like peptidoglycan-associated protein
MALPKENPTNKNQPPKSVQENAEASQLDALLSLMAELNIVNSGSKNQQKSTASEQDADDGVGGSLDASEKSPSMPEKLEESPLFESSPRKEKNPKISSLENGKKSVRKKEKLEPPKQQKDELKNKERSPKSPQSKPSPKKETTGKNSAWFPDAKDAVVDILDGGQTRVRRSTYKETLQKQHISKEIAKQQAETQDLLGGILNVLVEERETEKPGETSESKERKKVEKTEKKAHLKKEKSQRVSRDNSKKPGEIPKQNPKNKEEKVAPPRDEKAELEAISALFNLLSTPQPEAKKTAEKTSKSSETSPEEKSINIEKIVEEKTVGMPKTEEIVIGKNQSKKTASIPETRIQKITADKSEQAPKTPVAESKEITVNKPADAAVNSAAEDDAFMSLQNLLMGPEMDKFKELNIELEEKLTILQRKISDPQELTNLMLPLIAELLSLKIAEAKQEVAWAIAPIIDEAIERKTLEDQEGMVRAMAPLMAPAITSQIKKSPKEFAKAIAPEIAAAVEEQIRLGRETMVDALAPIIDRMIQKKTKDDKGSIIDAIAPLLPAAITEQIRTSPKEVARAIGPEIGAAIREQIKIDRNEIAEAIAPEMGRAIKEQITLERDAMVDALYPVIGSTISRYMAEAIQEINDKISKAVSMDGFRRKVRAKVRGVSEAELILSEVMHFTVQAIFLIHKGSGLIVSEAQHPGRERLESEMVAGMLTAIRSFVNDCIAQSGEVSELNEIEYGDSKIILEVAGYFYLAVVVKGDPKKDFIKKMRDTVSTIILKYGRPIEEFEGDPDSVPEEVKQLLEALMEVVNTPPKAAKFPFALIFLIVIIAGGIFIPWGYSRYRFKQEQQLAAEIAAENARLEQQVAGALATSPSLAVYRLNVEVEEGAIALSGKLPNQRLRQEAEEIAKKAAPNLELDNKIVAVEVPVAPEQVTVAVERVTGALNQIKGVSVVTEYAEGKVTAEGTVTDMAQSQTIVRELEQIPGVKSVVSTIKLSPLTLETRIYFDPNSAQLKPAYQETIAQIEEFLSQYPEKHLKINGYSDRAGNPQTNQQLALQRAEAVRDALVEEGVDARRLEVSGSANPPPGVESNQPLLLSRCVLFEPFEPGAK